MIYLGADHAGYAQKEGLKPLLHSLKLEFKDVGTDSAAAVDYPPIVTDALKEFDPQQDRAILLCGSGVGMAIVANKYRGIRAVVCWNPRVAQETREDNDANVLVIPARFVSAEQGQKIVKTFLGTDFSGAARHKRRIEEIKSLEQNR